MWSKCTTVPDCPAGCAILRYLHVFLQEPVFSPNQIHFISKYISFFYRKYQGLRIFILEKIASKLLLGKDVLPNIFFFNLLPATVDLYFIGFNTGINICYPPAIFFCTVPGQLFFIYNNTKIYLPIQELFHHFWRSKKIKNLIAGHKKQKLNKKEIPFNILLENTLVSSLLYLSYSEGFIVK